ncbi:MAG: YHS domain-containing protein [Candidatus Brocadiales bacterium]
MRPVALYLLFLVLTASVTSYYTISEGSTAQAAEEKVFDPVCGMEIDKASAATSEYEGSTYYFCSEMCKANFEKAPKKFACLCATGGHPGCKCAHCQKAVARCECALEAGGHEEGEHQHEGGEHHH